MADHSETVTRLRRLLLDPLVAAVVWAVSKRQRFRSARDNGSVVMR